MNRDKDVQMVPLEEDVVQDLPETCDSPYSYNLMKQTVGALSGSWTIVKKVAGLPRILPWFLLPFSAEKVTQSVPVSLENFLIGF